LQTDLTNLDAYNKLEALEAPLNSSGLKSDEVARRTRIVEKVEDLKGPAVRLGWLLCRYKSAVAAKLKEADPVDPRAAAPKLDAVKFDLPLEKRVGPVSEFLKMNNERKNKDNPPIKTCSEEILSAILFGTKTGEIGNLMDFSEDVDRLGEQENEIKSKIEKEKSVSSVPPVPGPRRMKTKLPVVDLTSGSKK
jgi:hypothetical protein